jgi:hypothetical protein
MYLMSRNARLTSAAAVEWAVTILGRAREVTGSSIELWTTVYSPSFGTTSWTSWWPDLSTLEAATTALQSDAKYRALVEEGRGHVDGAVDDELWMLVAGELDPERAASVKFVSGVRAVCAAGKAERAMTAGAETAQRAQTLTGLPTLFMGAVTGVFGEVGWLAGYESLGEFETSQGKLAAEPGWMAQIDAMGDCFVEDPSVTHQTLYQRLA